MSCECVLSPQEAKVNFSFYDFGGFSWFVAYFFDSITLNASGLRGCRMVTRGSIYCVLDLLSLKTKDFS